METNRDLKAKFFVGWINPESMQTVGWFNALLTTAQKAQDSGEELYIFRVPKGKKMLTAIEQTLQNMSND